MLAGVLVHAAADGVMRFAALAQLGYSYVVKGEEDGTTVAIQPSLESATRATQFISRYYPSGSTQLLI